MQVLRCITKYWYSMCVNKLGKYSIFHRLYFETGNEWVMYCRLAKYSPACHISINQSLLDCEPPGPTDVFVKCECLLYPRELWREEATIEQSMQNTREELSKTERNLRSTVSKVQYVLHVITYCIVEVKLVFNRVIKHFGSKESKCKFKRDTSCRDTAWSMLLVHVG